MSQAMIYFSSMICQFDQQVILGPKPNFSIHVRTPALYTEQLGCCFDLEYYFGLVFYVSSALWKKGDAVETSSLSGNLSIVE